MRSDMAKVIVERPRLGPRFKYPKGEKRENQRISLEESEKKEKIRFKWIKHYNMGKELNEHLNPLWRWLVSKVGQPWDKVHSEMCEHLRRSSAVQDHVRDHAEQFVERNVIMIDGIPCHSGNYAHGLPIGLSYHGELYVHPVTKVLCLYKSTGKKKKQKPLEIIKKDDKHVYKLINGVWYLFEVELYTPQYVMRDALNFKGKKVKRREFCSFNDKFIGHIGMPIDSEKFYGFYARGISKRQLNSNEIKKLRKEYDLAI